MNYQESQAKQKFCEDLAIEYGLIGQSAIDFHERLLHDPLLRMVYDNHEQYKKRVKNSLWNNLKDVKGTYYEDILEELK